LDRPGVGGHVGIDDVRDQHGMLGDHGASRFRDDLGARLPGTVTDVRDGFHDRARVILDRVVDRVGAARAGALVVHAQAAADVHQSQPQPGVAQVGVDPRGLGQAPADITQVRHLRADMDVQHLDAMAHANLRGALGRLQQLTGGQPELGLLATGILPVAGADARQPEADAEPRLELELPRQLDDAVELRELLDDDVHLVAESLRDQRQLQVLVILVAVAHDKPARRRYAEYGHQLRLAAGLHADPRAAVADQGVHHATLLVDLDRVNHPVAALVAGRRHRLAEGVVQAVEPVPENVGEAEEDRRGQARQSARRTRSTTSISAPLRNGRTTSRPRRPMSKYPSLQRETP
jgi:hypothetical protein